MFEQAVYMRYRDDCDDAYIGRTKDYKRRESEHWRQSDLLPRMIILDKVAGATESAAKRLAHGLETSWRRDFDAARIRLLNEAGRPKGAPRPEDPVIGELMPLRGVYKTYFPKTLDSSLRDALERKGVWVHGFGAPPAVRRRPTKPWKVTYLLPASVTECRTQAELDAFLVANREGWVLGIRSYWRIIQFGVGKRLQEPDTGSRLFCVKDGSSRNLDALVKVLLTHPAARKSDGR